MDGFVKFLCLFANACVSAPSWHVFIVLIYIFIYDHICCPQRQILWIQHCMSLNVKCCLHYTSNLSPLFSDCLKVYHPRCVGKDDSFTETGERWTCDRHSCLICHKSPKFYCYCCPNAVCGHCIGAAEFAPVRGKKGLCPECLELVLFVEEKEDLSADGGRIDLRDRNTYECLFLEYWDIIKEDEGLSLDDVYSADARLKKGQSSKYSFKSNTFVKGKKDIVLINSDSDQGDTEEFRTTGKGKGSKALEFMGWGSKPLIEFLRYLGKDTTKELSLHDVHSIISEYIKEKGLLDPSKRKRILCDERLYSVFRRKSMNKNKLYNLLEVHFVENLVSSDEDEKWDEVESFSHEKNEHTLVSHKKQRTESSSKKFQEMEADPRVQESCFASIISDNIKLVYLRRSLVEGLLKDPESFESKVVGSFVRVKNDPRDCMQRNSHKLLQVTGIKHTSTTDKTNGEIVLRLSTIPKDVQVSMLSDFDFSQEEIDDLRQIVEMGLLTKPTVLELQQRAKCLHEHITKDWIEKELVRLQKRIDFANEKGWRRELHEYLEQLELLKKPSEQERLMKQLPEVIAELIQLKTVSVDLSDHSPKGDD